MKIFWHVVFLAGAALLSSRALAVNCSGIPAWEASSIYTGGAQITHECQRYSAAWWTQGDNPETNSGQWQVWRSEGRCDSCGGGSSSSSSGSGSSSSGASSSSSGSSSSSSGASSSSSGSSSGSSSSSSGSSSSSSSSSSSGSGGTCPTYVAGTTYAAGDVVSNAGGYYQCTIAGWCSIGHEAYEPGIGWAYSQAWSDTSASACGGGSSSSSSGSSSSSSSSSSSGGGGIPNIPFCAEEWVTGKIYPKGARVAYNRAVYEALVDTHSIEPGNSTYPGQWSSPIGYPDPEMCPVPIPNTIDYGQPSPVDGNPNVGMINPTGTIGPAKISSAPSTLPGQRGGIDPSTDNGGDHAGLDVDNGARGSKLVPGSLPLQHNQYDLTSGTEIVTYIGDWAIYGRRYDFTKLAASNVNRIVYGFAGICYPDAKNVQDGGFPTSAPAAVLRTCAQSDLPDGAMAIADFEAAFVRDVGVAPQGVIGTESQYELDADKVGGVFGVLYQLREQNPELKLDLSVGGWTLSEGFYWMAGDPTRRKAFVDSIVHFLERFDFDGVDVDWEYPGTDGAVAGAATEADNQNYIRLIKEMRAGMDWLSRKTGKSYRLSSAIPAGLGRLEKITWSEVHPYLDRLYLMTYDLTGAWERELSHHTPLYTNPNAQGSSAGTSADWTINYMTSQGVPASKLMIGAANYHRAKAIRPGDITEYTNGIIGSSTYGDSNWSGASLILGVAGVGSWEAGVVEGYDLYQNYLDRDIRARNGYTLYTDAVANADYLVHEQIGSFITIETPRTVALKAQYAKDNGLAGIFFWMAEQDTGYNLNAVNHVLGNRRVADRSDADPAEQIPVCGTNITISECESLITPLR